MPRILIALLALLSLPPAARSDTPPSPADLSMQRYSTRITRITDCSDRGRLPTSLTPLPSRSPVARSAPWARPVGIRKCTRLDPAQSDRLDAD
jgi:hypothetical protein